MYLRDELYYPGLTLTLTLTNSYPPCSDSFFSTMATENRRFSVDHVRAVWLWIDIVDCVKRKKISGYAGGLSASYFFQRALEKYSMNSSSTGEASDIPLKRKPGPQKPLHGMLLQLIWKTSVYLWFNFANSWRLPRPQKWTPNKFFLFVTMPRSPQRMKDCMLLASDFIIGFL